MKGTCVLCGVGFGTYVVAGEGRVVKGTYEGTVIHKDDLVCGTCLISELANDENGNYVLVNKLVTIEPTIV